MQREAEPPLQRYDGIFICTFLLIQLNEIRFENSLQELNKIKSQTFSCLWVVVNAACRPHCAKDCSVFSGLLLLISVLIKLCVNGALRQNLLHTESNKSLCVCSRSMEV